MRRNHQPGRRSGTVNRGWLKRQVLKGNVEAKRDYRYSDNYALDAATDYGRTEWLPAYVAPDDPRGYYPEEGKVPFLPQDFRGFGRAWWNEDGTISLSFGWESYTLKLKK